MSMDLAYALSGYKLTNTARVIYGVLDALSCASAKKGFPYVWIGQRAIAERVGVCERTAHTAIKALASAGLIMIKRRGHCKTNLIFVMSPKATKQEKDKTRAICSSYPAKVAVHNITPKININNTDSKLSVPVNDNDAVSPQDKGTTSPKGKPTNKRPRRNIEEKQRVKKQYKDYLIRKWKLEKLKNNWLADDDDIRAMEKLIELVSNTMSNKGKIMVSGALLMPIQWWSVVKDISQDAVLDLLYRLEHTTKIKNYRAYLLASLYNTAMEETLVKPWYNHIS